MPHLRVSELGASRREPGTTRLVGCTTHTLHQAEFCCRLLVYHLASHRQAACCRLALKALCPCTRSLNGVFTLLLLRTSAHACTSCLPLSRYRSSLATVSFGIHQLWLPAHLPPAPPYHASCDLCLILPAIL